MHESTARPELLPGISLRDSTASAAKTSSGSRGWKSKTTVCNTPSRNHGECAGIEEEERRSDGGWAGKRSHLGPGRVGPEKHHEVLQIPQAQ
jgi:hypothetical protein